MTEGFDKIIFPRSVADFRLRNFQAGLGRFFFCLLKVVWIAFFCGCSTVYNPATGKKEMLLIDSAQEVQIGRSMADEIVKKEIPPLADPAKQRFVNAVGLRVAQVSDRQELIYRFQVLDSADLNAFALPGGYVFIYRGLLDKLDESELAAVLAHEVAHVAAKHSVKRMQSELGYNVLLSLALVALNNKSPQLAENISGLSDVVYGLLSKGYGRQDELLADQLAVGYLWRAGYDPYSLAGSLEILSKESGPGGRVFEILSTHPRMEERIKKAREEASRISSRVLTS